ncbi:cuticle protein 3-like isoform X3 [Diabrotica virgifera virgifera]|uniref:Pupal cuticle protein 20-like n=1 Tax=Diabrotica virgifera virgifera TaxID=50390 RepID=A0ABM5JTG8_DIAVI|nr:cuticle protein 3-like isoform X1 [Diabrotica virgifera virgifera]XP_050501233.1 cuticle protein 3-like isoform X2 [Diabrotica virgifera virgifera]XP_050501234.1 cuticle protein 3-like isoform X3 [Diabrotica virgifera virgifera]
MRQFVVLFAIIGLSYCGRLENTYLPPNQGGGYDSAAHASFNKISTHSANSFSSQNSFQQSSFNNKYSAPAPSGPAGPINKEANDVPILRLDNNNDGETYNYALETGNGISMQEQGDASHDGTNAQGGFSYTAPDGQQISIQYVAGESGFVPQGAHIPTAPPVPEDIQKALEQNLADEARGIVDDGQYREEGESGQYNQAAYGGHGGRNEQATGASKNNFNFQPVKNQYIPPSNNGKQGYHY